MSDREMITVRLDFDIVATLVKISKESGLSMSQHVRKAVVEYISEWGRKKGDKKMLRLVERMEYEEQLRELYAEGRFEVRKLTLISRQKKLITRLMQAGYDRQKIRPVIAKMKLLAEVHKLKRDFNRMLKQVYHVKPDFEVAEGDMDGGIHSKVKQRTRIPDIDQGK